MYAIGASTFEIEKGFFFPKDYTADIDQIQDIRGDDIILSRGKAHFGSGDALVSEAANQSTVTRTEETRMPLVEERLEAEKFQRESGEVVLQKRVETELKTLEVPVRKEHVEVQRTAAPPASGEVPGTAFQEETIRVPVMEEEVEIRKRPVVREEVRVRKQVGTEERRVAETVRREEADLRSSGDVEELDRQTGSIDPTEPGPKRS